MQRIGSNEQFRAICEAGHGVVYNDFAGQGASGAQYNVVHAASCRWLARSNLNVPKVWFGDLAEATGWLVRERGPEGRGWKRCATCHATGRSTASSPPVRLRPTAATPRPGPLHAHPPYVVVAEAGGSRVEAWSSTRLPFQPTGVMGDFRGDLASAVARLSAGPTEALHALYASPVGEQSDVENVLLYNVGSAAFRESATRELVVERTTESVPTPPAGLARAQHHYRYEIVALGTPWRRWAVVRPLASFGPVEIGTSAQVSRPGHVWYAVRRGREGVPDGSHLRSVFGVDLVLEAPTDARVNLAALAKPLIDGVVVAFHSHDDPASLDVVAGRVATSLGVLAAEVRSLLGPGVGAILGARRLLWPWRDGVQWNPADDLCVAIRIRRVTRAAEGKTRTFRLQGSIVEIEQVGLP